MIKYKIVYNTCFTSSSHQHMLVPWCTDMADLDAWRNSKPKIFNAWINGWSESFISHWLALLTTHSTKLSCQYDNNRCFTNQFYFHIHINNLWNNCKYDKNMSTFHHLYFIHLTITIISELMDRLCSINVVAGQIGFSKFLHLIDFIWNSIILVVNVI